MKILVSNDDGLYAPGVKHLAEIASKYGEVLVCAPDKPRSAMSSAMTLGEPLRLKKRSIFGENIEAYTCSGTPTDCVKLALNKLCDEKPDLVLSGINHGSNSSINVVYSGTMAAALEGAMANINSIGFSFLNGDHAADFAPCLEWVPKVIEMALQYGFPPSRLLNVNVPDLKASEIEGVKICRQANARWKEDYDERVDPFGETYYWLRGEFVNFDKRPTTDLSALESGYVSVVPVNFELTPQKSLDFLNDNWVLKKEKDA